MKSTVHAATFRAGTFRGVLPLALLFGAVLSTATGCKQDEAPPPLPTAKPAETPAVATIMPEEDEETEEESTSDETTKKGGKGGGSSLSKCCAALRQNAVNAPPETKGHMESAAAACDAAAKAGASSVIGVISRFGIKVPPVCQ
jgi:hypothetical protein